MSQKISNTKASIINQCKKGISYLIPSSCLLCEMDSEHLICSACSEQFFSATIRRCASCALPVLNQDTHCGACIKNPLAFDATVVACDYIAPLDQLVLALKFGHRLAVAPAFAELLSRLLSTTPDEQLPDYFIAVPLSHQRLAQRGFNQSLEIAKPLARKLSRPIYTHLLNRIRNTQAQTLLHPDQRQENILNAFSVSSENSDKICGKHIGVVDDVMTTGATLNEIARCLKHHGAIRVTNVVFARTPPH